MSLVTPDEVRVVVATTLADEELQTVIDREEAEVVRLYGAHYVDSEMTVSETHEGGYLSLFVNRAISSVTEVVEDDTTLTEDEDYEVWAAQGRLLRLPVGAWWGRVVTVTYVPADDNVLRKGVIIDLVRLALERTAMRQESLRDTEYSYTAPDWEVERARILARLSIGI